jgi:hypothetical protein
MDPNQKRGGFGRRAFLCLVAGLAPSSPTFRPYAPENTNFIDLNAF